MQIFVSDSVLKDVVYFYDDVYGMKFCPVLPES